MTDTLRRIAPAAAVACALGLLPSAAFAQKDAKGKDAKEDDSRRPKLVLKATPMISMSPSRVVFTGELVGGANDYQEFYCPTIQWEWGDGTQSSSSSDCEPYEAGKTEIRRRFTVEHVFRAGNYRVNLRLKRNDKVLALAGANVQVQPGLRDQ
jgi:hypothetical protein